VRNDARGGAVVSTQVVTYQVDESTVVSFEIDPVPGFRQAGANEIAGKVRDAVGPAVEAAKVVLDKVKEACPEQVEVKFGIKVSGGANWLIARAATEGSFEVTLSWSPSAPRATDEALAASAVPEQPAMTASTAAGDPPKPVEAPTATAPAPDPTGAPSGP
jgi:hypothetical protein